MKVPLSWLADYVDIDISPHELAERMTLAGVEAEEVTVTGDSWDGVVVGLVESVDLIPTPTVCGWPRWRPGRAARQSSAGPRTSRRDRRSLLPGWGPS